VEVQGKPEKNGQIGQGSGWQPPQQQFPSQNIQPPFQQQPGYGYGYPPAWGFHNQFQGPFPSNQWVNPQNWQANAQMQAQMQQQQQFPMLNQNQPPQVLQNPAGQIPVVQPVQVQQPATQGLSKNQLKNQKKAKAVAKALLRQREKDTT
jgi:hypothetical protein